MADIAVVTGMTATAKMTGAITVVAIRYQFIELNRTKGQASICLFCMGAFFRKILSWLVCQKQLLYQSSILNPWLLFYP